MIHSNYLAKFKFKLLPPHFFVRFVLTLYSSEIGKNDFAFNYVIGRGGFGKVWKVEQKKTHKLYAMKEMFKARVIAKRSVHSVMNEKKFLSYLYHP